MGTRLKSVLWIFCDGGKTGRFGDWISSLVINHASCTVYCSCLDSLYGRTLLGSLSLPHKFGNNGHLADISQCNIPISYHPSPQISMVYSRI